MMPANKSEGTDRSARELLRGLSLAAFLVVLHSTLAFERCVLVVPTLAMAETYQGFGASTLGGTGQPIYSVTNLNDAGPGSLRDAVSQGKRYITFKTAGEIQLTSDLYVQGAFLTIDGLTAPAPGITLKNHGILIRGHHGAHNLIVRGIRVRDSIGCDTCTTSGAGISIGRAAYNIVLDHVSVQGAQDQALGIGKNAHDITVQWSIFAESKSATGTNLPVLIGPSTMRVSLHHNLLIKGYERLPQVKYSDSGVQAIDTQIDLRNNLIWEWQSVATQIWKGTRANVVANYYYTPNGTENTQKHAIYFCHAGSKPPQCNGMNPQWFAQAYIAANVSGYGQNITAYLNSLGTELSPFAAPLIEITDACTAAQRILQNAGARPLDGTDQLYISQVSLAGCTTPHFPDRKE
jgi:pectate lyase